MILDPLINKHYDALNDNDLHIINVIHQHIDEMVTMKIQDLSHLTHTSISTIHRLVKKLGFEISTVNPSDLCVYLTSQTTGGIDDVFIES